MWGANTTVRLGRVTCRKGLGATVRRPVARTAPARAVASLVALSIAVYNKVFTKVRAGKLETDHTGNQLLTQLGRQGARHHRRRGRSISFTRDGATITLASTGQGQGDQNYQVPSCCPRRCSASATCPSSCRRTTAAASRRTASRPRTPGPVKGGQTMCQDNSAQYAEIQNASPT